LTARKELLFIYPRLRYPSGDVPLGLLYLAASVRARLGIIPDIKDLSFSKKPLQEIRRHLLHSRYRWIGISAMITMADAARRVANLAREIQPEAKIILGGPHPTTLPEKCLEADYDFLVMGEAEDTMVDLIEKGQPEDVPGLWYKRSREWVKNPDRAPSDNLDRIPFPAFDLIDLDRYKRLWFQLDTIGRPVAGTSVLGTRGCPYRCSFCQPTLEKLFGKKLRKRSPANIVSELWWLKERFKIQGVFFLDDTLNVDRGWSQELAEKMISAKLDLVFGCNMRAELVDRPTLEIMKEAGLRKICLGIESCSEKIRNEILNKKITHKQIENAVAIARDLGLKVQGYFMIGAPGESKAEVKSTLSYPRQLELDDLTINITTPLPATYLYQRYHGDISLPEEKFDYYRRYAFKPGELSQRWLRGAQIFGYLAFYLRPRKFAEQIRLLLAPRFFYRTLLKLKRVF